MQFCQIKGILLQLQFSSSDPSCNTLNLKLTKRARPISEKHDVKITPGSVLVRRRTERTRAVPPAEQRFENLTPPNLAG